jgi:GT2 family glycosyltransferase
MSRALGRESSTDDTASVLKTGSVEALSGCCMMVNTLAFEQVGGFDERFFMYFEDDDLCKRLREVGFELRYNPATHIIHFKGGSSRQNESRYLWHLNRSAYLYAMKHHQADKSILFKPMVILGTTIHGLLRYGYYRLRDSKQFMLRLFM